MRRADYAVKVDYLGGYSDQGECCCRMIEQHSARIVPAPTAGFRVACHGSQWPVRDFPGILENGLAFRDVAKMAVMRSETAAIRAAAPSDSSAIAAIYNHYVAETVVTFEEKPVHADEMARRIEDVRSASLPWLVAEAGQVVGSAYAAPWKARSAYRFSMEITVYVAPGKVGHGIVRCSIARSSLSYAPLAFMR